jgi:ribosomal protein S18 acetylase RimI-like enzyme
MTTVSTATPADADQILAVLNDACFRLREKQIKQWPESFSRDFVDARIRNSEFYTISLEAEILAVFRLLWSDYETWGLEDGQAGYVHSLAVHRKARGRRLGTTAIAWASDEIAKAGKRYIRLDCVSDNHSLSEYYTKLGFSIVRETIVRGTRLTLFQKAI